MGKNHAPGLRRCVIICLVTSSGFIFLMRFLSVQASILYLVFFCSFLLSTPALQARPKNLQELSAIADKMLVTKIEYGAIPSLYRPRFEPVKNADLNMTKESIVFVVMLPDGPRIYPQSIMVWHQVVNELIDDHAYVITYCPTTGTLMAYDAGMNGLNLIFDAEGRLYDGNTILIDRNSGSLWLQELGMAFEGPLLGRGLPTLPVFWTTWAAARKVYPDAKVMSNPPGNRAYGRDPYGNYLKKGTYYDNDILIYPLQRMDKRFHRKTPMLCLEIDGFLVGIEIAYVKKQGAVNFFLGQHALLAVHDTQLDVVRVFERNIWADPFLFVKQYGKLIDLNTRSVWNAATGQSMEGNMRGAKLKQYFGGYSMWLAWYSLNPETFVIPGPGEVPANLLSVHQPGVDNATQNKQMRIPEPKVVQPQTPDPGKPMLAQPHTVEQPSSPALPASPTISTTARPTGLSVPASPKAPQLPQMEQLPRQQNAPQQTPRKTMQPNSQGAPATQPEPEAGLPLPLPSNTDTKSESPNRPASVAPLPDKISRPY